MGTTRGFIFDYSKCVGCHACVVACSVENSTVPPLSWRSVNHFNKQKLPLLGYVHLSLACNHCQEAPCLKACPSGAYRVDTETNAVIHTPELCLGCKYCTWACPFDAPKYNHKSGVVEKCHFCFHRLKDGQIPACAQNCPTGALSFGEIEEKSSPNAFGLSNREIYPRIKILGEDVKANVPQADVEATTTGAVSSKRILAQAKGEVREWLNEWPLALFTFLAALLVGWQWAGIVSQSISLSPWLFAIIGGTGMLASTLHLGKPTRAYLSINNLNTSWLSREILMFGLFMATGFGSKLFPVASLQIVSMVFGVFLLLSIEMLYISVSQGLKTLVTSGNTFGIALVFASLFAQQMDLLIVLLALKTMLFIITIGHSQFKPSAVMALLSLFRISVGFLVPFGLISLKNENFTWVLLAVVVVGEFSDRLAFYYQFKPERPFDEISSSVFK
ncbi:MAG: DmsC/YnfH family molybdoenzyme membrane anchor subunit [Tenuifilaceae bacterium]|nr:DmsC/YnfH family molybdoenzyme membrane anchor subunit [Tenuifilaceae bacterium]